MVEFYRHVMILRVIQKQGFPTSYNLLKKGKAGPPWNYSLQYYQLHLLALTLCSFPEGYSYKGSAVNCNTNNTGHMVLLTILLLISWK
jgi:hypothetical protein